jgi:hypothetical protein
LPIETGYIAAIQLGALQPYFDRRVLDAMSRTHVPNHTDRFGVFLVGREAGPDAAAQR